MIPKMKDNLLITPELAPIFTTNEDDLKATIGKITRLLDGKGFTGDTGAHGQRGYTETMFSWIGAAVEIPETVWKLLSILGWKIYFMRPEVAKITEDDLANDILDEDFKDKINHVKISLYDYLRTFDAAPECNNISRNDKGGVLVKWDRLGHEEQLIANRYLAKLALVLRHLRGTIEIYANKKRYNPNEDEDDNIDFRVDNPILEQPNRAKNILTKLATAHAIAEGRDFYDVRDMPLVFNVGLSSAMAQRTTLFKVLIENEGSITTSEVASKLNFTLPTARRNMRIFAALGLVSTGGGTGKAPFKITLKEEFNWFLSDEYKEIIGKGSASDSSKMSTTRLAENFPTPLIGEGGPNHEKGDLTRLAENFPTPLASNDQNGPEITNITKDMDNQDKHLRVGYENVQLNKSSHASNGLAKEEGPRVGYENFQLNKLGSSNLTTITIEPKPDPIPEELQNVKFASFDTEWSTKPNNDGRRTVLSIALTDYNGNKFVKDITDFEDCSDNPSEKQLLEWFLLDVYDNYDLYFGYATTEVKNQKMGVGIDSDLVTLHNAIESYNLPQIIKFDDTNRPFIRGKDHIDLYRVYSQGIVNGIFGGVYNGNGLGDLAEGLLSKEKYGKLTGSEAVNLTPEERKKYVLQDSDLTLDLVKHDDYKIIKIMSGISKLVKLSLVDVCHSTIGKWWSSRILNEGYDNDLKPLYNFQKGLWWRKGIRSTYSTLQKARLCFRRKQSLPYHDDKI